MSDQTTWVRSVIPVLDNISKTVCMAKWYKSTIYLQTGETHSCYHPFPHKIPITGLSTNPSMLHNTPHKKEERREMLEGKFTSGCQYCWNVERLGGEFISDRLLNSAYIYTEEKLERIKSGPWNQDVNPEYLELSFSNKCNFKCGYCHPRASSRYMREIQKYGPYTMVENHRLDFGSVETYKENNQYLAAFWRWWPSLKNDLKLLRITGGEPLLHDSTWRLFDSIGQDPLPELELSINSNLGVNRDLIQRLADNVNLLIRSKAIKQFKLYTSIDTWGARAEYLRTGLDLRVWEKNLDLYIRETHSPVAFSSTFNVLSVTTFYMLLEKVLEWRRKYADLIYHDGLSGGKIALETHCLTEPLQYDINILPKDEFMPYMEKNLEFLRNHVDPQNPRMFSELEFEKFKRVIEYMRNTEYSDDLLVIGRRDFGNWFDEYDRRRKTNFLALFHEYSGFYSRCKEL